jgi:hypothetical protein
VDSRNEVPIDYRNRSRTVRVTLFHLQERSRENKDTLRQLSAMDGRTTFLYPSFRQNHSVFLKEKFRVVHAEWEEDMLAFSVPSEECQEVEGLCKTLCECSFSKEYKVEPPAGVSVVESEEDVYVCGDVQALKECVVAAGLKWPKLFAE